MASSWGGSLWKTAPVAQDENPLEPLTPTKEPAPAPAKSSWGTSSWSGSKTAALWNSATKPAAESPGGPEQDPLELWARQLMEMTTDDQSTVHKHAVKQLAETIAGDAATADMQAEFADILGKRLADPSVSVKLKTIRVITLLMPDVAGFQEKVEAKAGQVLRDHVTYSCVPDLDHGDRPQTMIRAAAERCIAMFASAGSPAATAQSPAPAESAAPVPAAATGGAAVGAPGEVAVLVELVEALAGRLQAVEKSQANSSGGGAGGGGEEMEEALARVEDVEAEMAEQQVMLGSLASVGALQQLEQKLMAAVAEGGGGGGAGSGAGGEEMASVVALQQLEQKLMAAVAEGGGGGGDEMSSPKASSRSMEELVARVDEAVASIQTTAEKAAAVDVAHEEEMAAMRQRFDETLARIQTLEEEAAEQQQLVGSLAQQSLVRQRRESMEASQTPESEEQPFDREKVIEAVEEAIAKSATETDAAISRAASDLREELLAANTAVAELRLEVMAGSTADLLSSTIAEMQSKLESCQRSSLDLEGSLASDFLRKAEFLESQASVETYNTNVAAQLKEGQEQAQEMGTRLKAQLEEAQEQAHEMDTRQKQSASALAADLAKVEAALRDSLSTAAADLRELDQRLGTLVGQHDVAVDSRLGPLEAGLSALQGGQIGESEFSNWASQQTARMDSMASQLTAALTGETAAGKAAALDRTNKQLEAAERRIIGHCDSQAAGVDSRLTAAVEDAERLADAVGAMGKLAGLVDGLEKEGLERHQKFESQISGIDSRLAAAAEGTERVAETVGKLSNHVDESDKEALERQDKFNLIIARITEIGQGKTDAEHFDRWSAEQASKLSVLQSLFETVRQASDARADELTDRLTSEYNILFEKLTATESTLGSKVAEINASVDEKIGVVLPTMAEAGAGVEKQVTDLSSRMMALDASVDEKIGAVLPGVERQVTELAAKLTAVGSKCEATADVLSATDAIVSEVNGKVNALAGTQAEVEIKISGLDAEVYKLGSSIDGKIDVLPGLQQQVAETSAEVASLTSKQEATAAALPGLQKQTSELSSKLTSLGSKHEATADVLSATDEIVGQVNGKLKAMADKQVEADATVTALDGKIAKLDASIGTAQLDGAATATQGIQELLDPLRTAINTLSTVQTETSANVDALSVGQQEQLRQLAESSQTALASATAGLAEDIAAQKLVLEKAVEDHAAAAAQRDALTEAVAGCASSSALAEALKAQNQTVSELGNSVGLAMQKTVTVCGERVTECTATITRCSNEIVEVRTRMDQAETWMAESETGALQTAAEMEEARLLAEDETAMREKAAMPFTVIVKTAMIRQKVNSKPYVVYQFDISYRGAVHRFFERYSTIYDFYVLLKKELKLPKEIRFPVKYSKTLDPDKLEGRRAELDRFFNLLFNWGLRNGVPLLRMSSIQRWLLKTGDLPAPEVDEGVPKLLSLDEESVVPGGAGLPPGSPGRESRSASMDGVGGAAAGNLRVTTASKRDMLKKMANESAVMEAAGGK